MKQNFSNALSLNVPTLAFACVSAVVATFAITSTAAYAQNVRHVSPAQKAAAQKVASQGVPLSALAKNAPNEYTVKRGDTLWRISGMFLKTPWRWPELWGMNLNEIKNPHLIYPGQQLYLETVNGRARLRARKSVDGQTGPLVRVSPRTREEMLDASPIPTLAPHLIDPFLAEPLVLKEGEFEAAPRVVALSETNRILISKGDRAYALGSKDAPLLRRANLPTNYRVFRNIRPLKDPESGEILGYQGQYAGQVELVRGQGEVEADPQTQEIAMPNATLGNPDPQYPTTNVNLTEEEKIKFLTMPATIDVRVSRDEIRPGDRLIPEPPREYRNYTPRAPIVPVDAKVITLYGETAVRFGGQHSIIAINKGSDDGIVSGDVLALLRKGRQVVDKTTKEKELLQLPDERNGVAMVFRTFDKVSYALIMEVTHPVQAGDKLVNPK